ncbi:MAG: N-acetylneuraminate synthase family protein [Oligoflexia bacterium]|nr:N-acetylneuraminate synthase family protein [Oligoflexia bacterium]
MLIGNTNTDQKILVIAEIGNNHEGSYTLAEEMVGRAAETGVQAVKFQTFKTEFFQSRSTDEARFSRLKSFELKYSQFEKLSKLAKSLGLLFGSTPLDLESADYLNNIVDFIKIASSDSSFYPLLEKVSTFNKPIILSSGLTSLEQLKKSKHVIEHGLKQTSSNKELAVLHCVTCYPVPPEQANLRAIHTLKSELGCSIGYSDHTLGIDAALLATVQGARIIEKHFTINKNQSEFRDHKLSADPAEMKMLVKKINNLTSKEIINEIPGADAYLGSGQKNLQECELANRALVRRSISAKNFIKAGTSLTLADLSWTRPGHGLPPGDEDKILGKTLLKNLNQGEQITLEHLR